MAVVVTAGGYVLLLLADTSDLPPDLWVFMCAVLGLYLAAHLAVRRFAPRADATLLPIAAVLNGIGFVAISRLDRDLARIQAGGSRWASPRSSSRSCSCARFGCSSATSTRSCCSASVRC